MSRDSSYIDGEHLEAAVGTVPELIHAVSHDIGEPVREILGFAKLIAERAPRDVDPHFLADLDHVTSGALRTRAMLDVVCDYIRIDATTPEVAPVDLASFAASLHDRVDALAGPGAHPVELETHLDGVVATVPAVLDAVIDELLRNAARFGASPDGVARVRVEATVTDDTLEIQVSDAGTGIPADATERALQLFQRLHPRSHFDTMGAGLALARRRVEHCGGELRLVPSAPGSGLRVVVRLPVPAIDLRDLDATPPTGTGATALTPTTEGEVR
jgi:signal transduction histidine kinase